MPVRFPPLARITCLAGTLGASLLVAATAFAQTPPSSESNSQPDQGQPAQASPAPQPAAPAPVAQPLHPIDPIKARYTVQVMESVLERAVRYAAGRMNNRLQAVSPDLLQLSGAARARGFRLPGYGVFFDVDVPAALRHTMGWTLRLMQQSDQNVQRAVAELKQLTTSMDPKQRAQAEMALKMIEMRFEPAPRPRSGAPQQEQAAPETVTAETVTASSAAPAGSGPLNNAAFPGATIVTTVSPAPAPADSVPPAASVPPPAPSMVAPEAAAPTAEDLAWAQNPDLAYEMEVRDALVSAMLEYGTTLSLGPDEYLTVAARDSENVVMPGDLSETVTVLLRIKGSDLFEYKSGRMSEADARRRIEVREF
jgi:hypothetical protein